MKAVTLSRYGSPEHMSLEELPRPVPRKGEVVIKVAASGVNSWDVDLVRGAPWLSRLEGGPFGPKRKVLGCDVAGVVEAVGPEAGDFTIGDRVFGDLSAGAWGGFAEYARAEEQELARMPDGMSFAEAAAVPQAGVLALQGLEKYGGIKAGERLLIVGAGGGVGTLALQMAKELGAVVSCVDRGDKLERLTELGADRVIDYEREDFCRDSDRYDLILDVTARRRLAEYSRALNPGGRMAAVGGTARAIFSLLLFGGRRMGLVLHRPNRRDLERLAGAWSAGKLKVIIDRQYPLAEVPAAIERLSRGDVFGKLVISVEENL